jgi:hypothetical protein
MRILVIFLVASCIVVAGGALYAWYALNIFGACRYVVLTSIPSPDGKKSVVIFRKECGATVSDTSHASIASAGAPFSADKYPAFLSLVSSPEILAWWRGNGVVEIALIPGGAREIRREQNVGDIRIEYK